MGRLVEPGRSVTGQPTATAVHYSRPARDAPSVASCANFHASASERESNCWFPPVTQSTTNWTKLVSANGPTFVTEGELWHTYIACAHAKLPATWVSNRVEKATIFRPRCVAHVAASATKSVSGCNCGEPAQLRPQVGGQPYRACAVVGRGLLQQPKPGVGHALKVGVFFTLFRTVRRQLPYQYAPRQAMSSSGNIASPSARRRC